MSSPLKLSIVDQSPVHDNGTQADALLNTLALAEDADRLGYHRYWIAEHHATPSYASPCPEIVIGRIAAATQRIRVGSGGVMLQHYSPYKVAEVFRTLSAFHGDRIDLGIGRAPGGAQKPSVALAYPHYPSAGDDFVERLELLSGFLFDDLPDTHPLHDLSATPNGASIPQLWSLGSSDGSIGLAASHGIGFVLALFIGTQERPAHYFEDYRRLFRPRPSSPQQAPRGIIANAVITAETAEEAKLLASSHTYWKVLAFLHGIREGLRPPEECLDLVKKLSPSDQAYFHETRNSMITGTPVQCRETIEAQSAYYGVDEFMAVAVTHNFEKRRDSYRRLANVFELG